MLKENRPVGLRLALSIGLAGVMLAAFAGCNSNSGEKPVTMAELQARVEALESEVKALKGDASAVAQQSAAEEDADNSSRPFSTNFTDLGDVATKDMIADLGQLGVFEGMGDEFKPYEPITRGEYITWLYKAYNKLRPEADRIRLAPQATAKFKDLNSSHPAYKYVQAMSNAGFSVGYEDGTFKADQPITREEMIAIKVGVDTGTEHQKPSYYYDIVYTDRDQVDERYKGYVYKDWWQISGPYKGNFIRAYGKVKNFKPKEPVLRNEAAATLWQVDASGNYTAKALLEGKNAQ